MSELTPLREAVDALASRSPSPDFGELRRRASRRGRRRLVTLAAAGAVAFIAVGGSLPGGNAGGSDRVLPVGDPPLLESTEPPASFETFAAELDAILEHVPGWAVGHNIATGYDYAFNGPCSGNWNADASSGGDGGASSNAGIGQAGFLTAAHASDAAARLVENLASCTATEWRTQPIARTGAVLASSALAVTWIQRTGDTVGVLQVDTTDGPPPVSIQVEVVEWMAAYHTWQEQNH